jgi:hypothetical protein
MLGHAWLASSLGAVLYSGADGGFGDDLLRRFRGKICRMQHRHFTVTIKYNSLQDECSMKSSVFSL